MRPSKTPYAIAERERAVLVGVRAQRTNSELATIVGVSKRSIERIRLRLRERGLL